MDFPYLLKASRQEQREKEREFVHAQTRTQVGDVLEQGGSTQNACHPGEWGKERTTVSGKNTNKKTHELSVYPAMTHFLKLHIFKQSRL